jgi:hypothetical protein
MEANEEARALEELDALREMRDQEGLPAGILVLACSAAGQVDEAYRWLDVAEREEGGVSLLVFCGVPPLNPIRREARFGDRMKRLGIRDEVWLWR